MADFDAKLPIRGLAVDVTVEVADAAGTTINPAKEDGKLASIKTSTDNLDVALSTVATEATVATLATEATVATLATEATVSTLATEATVATLATEATVATLATEATVATLATEVTAAAIQTAVEIIDDWDNGADRANVDIQANATVNVAQVGGLAVSLGQAAMASSIPVVIASNQSPVPVTMSGAGLTNAFSYNTATVAAANSNTHTYTPAGTVFMSDIYASASGQMKIEIQFGLTGSEATIAVLFTSKGDLMAHFHSDDAMQVLATQSIKVIRTNMDNQSMNVYSTVCVQS